MNIFFLLIPPKMCTKETRLVSSAIVFHRWAIAVVITPSKLEVMQLELRRLFSLRIRAVARKFYLFWSDTADSLTLAFFKPHVYNIYMRLYYRVIYISDISSMDSQIHQRDGTSRPQRAPTRSILQQYRWETSLAKPERERQHRLISVLFSLVRRTGYIHRIQAIIRNLSRSRER